MRCVRLGKAATRIDTHCVEHGDVDTHDHCVEHGEIDTHDHCIEHGDVGTHDHCVEHGDVSLRCLPLRMLQWLIEQRII